MKKTLLGLVAILGLALPASAIVSPTYVSVVKFTPGGADAKVLAFQNASAKVDVRVLRVEVSAASTGTYTGGLMQFWVYGSTVITHSDTTTASSYTYASANGASPASIYTSTAPLNVQYESKAASQLPLFRPLIVNNDETAAANFKDEYIAEGGDSEVLLLPKGSSRGLVFEQRRLGTADITDGTVMVRIVYTAK